MKSCDAYRKCGKHSPYKNLHFDIVGDCNNLCCGLCGRMEIDMHFIYAGSKEGRLFLECNKFEVYRVPFGIRVSSKKVNCYSVIACLLMVIIPLLYQHTKNPVQFLFLTFIPFVFVAMVIFESRKIRDREFEKYVVHFPQSRVNDVILPDLRKYVIKNIIRTLFITLFLLLFEIGGLYFIFIEKSFDYRILLCLNAPTGLVLVWGGFRPIKTIIYYYKFKNNNCKHNATM